jgi:lipase chaperone LimK
MNDRQKLLEQRLALLHEEKTQRLAELKHQQALYMKNLDIKRNKKYASRMKGWTDGLVAWWEAKQR